MFVHANPFGRLPNYNNLGAVAPGGPKHVLMTMVRREMFAKNYSLKEWFFVSVNTVNSFPQDIHRLSSLILDLYLIT